MCWFVSRILDVDWIDVGIVNSIKKHPNQAWIHFKSKITGMTNMTQIQFEFSNVPFATLDNKAFWVIYDLDGHDNSHIHAKWNLKVYNVPIWTLMFKFQLGFSYPTTLGWRTSNTRVLSTAWNVSYDSYPRFGTMKGKNLFLRYFGMPGKLDSLLKE